MHVARRVIWGEEVKGLVTRGKLVTLINGGKRDTAVEKKKKKINRPVECEHKLKK